MCVACRVHRRNFLAGLATSALLGGAPKPVLAADEPRRIDVHYHHITPEWINDDNVRKTFPAEVLGIARQWSPERAIEEMDRHGIRTAVCSTSNPGVWFGDVDGGRRLARACNEYAARMGRDHPGRFSSFAALPLPDTEGSLNELAYALDLLDASGVGLFTNYGDKWLADPAFAPVFRELNRRKAVVYVHPIAASCCTRLMPGIPAALIEFPIDTSRAIMQWITRKCTTLYPDLRIIFSHDGGLFMAGVGRFQILAETQPDFGLPRSIPAEIAKLYYEISSSADAPTMTMLRSYVPVSHILLGTDSPFNGSMTPNLREFDALQIDQSDRAAIERENAVAIMPRLR